MEEFLKEVGTELTTTADISTYFQEISQLWCIEMINNVVLIIDDN